MVNYLQVNGKYIKKAIISRESQPQNPEFRNNPENFHTCRGLNSSFLMLNTVRYLPLDVWIKAINTAIIKKWYV